MPNPFQGDIFQYIFNTDMSVEEAVFQGNIFQGISFQPQHIIRRSSTTTNVEETTPHLSILRKIVNKLIKTMYLHIIHLVLMY